MGRKHPAGRSLAARVPGKAEISAQAALNRGNLHDVRGSGTPQKTGLLFGTGPGGRGLEIRDAATGELLPPPLEARRQEAEARRQAEERAEQEAEARRQADERGVEDLCAVLGIAWNAERSAQVENMSSSELEALRRHLVNEKTWPVPSSDAQP